MPFVVLTLGMAYGWRLGAATVIARRRDLD